MLGNEPGCHGVSRTSREVWGRGPWSVHILSSYLIRGLPEGQGKAPNEIRAVEVLEKVLYRVR